MSPVFPENYPASHQLKFSETKSTCQLAYEAFQGDIYRFPDDRKWKVIARRTEVSGFKAIVVKSETDPRVVISFAGTNPTSKEDMLTNLEQESGLIPAQYVQAVSLASFYRDKYGSNLILTGHSLGGGLAVYASMMTNVPANTMNPAPMSETNFKRFACANYINQITNYVTGTEFITNIGVTRTVTQGKVAPRLIVIGKIVKVAGVNVWNSYIENHHIHNTATEIPPAVNVTPRMMPGGFAGMTEFETTMSR